MATQATQQQIKENKRKQEFLNALGYNIKVDGSWGPWQEEQYNKIVSQIRSHNHLGIPVIEKNPAAEPQSWLFDLLTVGRGVSNLLGNTVKQAVTKTTTKTMPRAISRSSISTTARQSTPRVALAYTTSGTPIGVVTQETTGMISPAVTKTLQQSLPFVTTTAALAAGLALNRRPSPITRSDNVEVALRDEPTNTTTITSRETAPTDTISPAVNPNPNNDNQENDNQENQNQNQQNQDKKSFREKTADRVEKIANKIRGNKPNEPNKLRTVKNYAGKLYNLSWQIPTVIDVAGNVIGYVSNPDTYVPSAPALETRAAGKFSPEKTILDLFRSVYNPASVPAKTETDSDTIQAGSATQASPTVQPYDTKSMIEAYKKKQK